MGASQDLKVVYAGAYLVRNVDQVQDYTDYAHSGVYVDYYQCVNPGPKLGRGEMLHAEFHLARRAAQHAPDPGAAA